MRRPKEAPQYHKYPCPGEFTETPLSGVFFFFPFRIRAEQERRATAAVNGLNRSRRLSTYNGHMALMKQAMGGS